MQGSTILLVSLLYCVAVVGQWTLLIYKMTNTISSLQRNSSSFATVPENLQKHLNIKIVHFFCCKTICNLSSEFEKNHFTDVQ